MYNIAIPDRCQQLLMTQSTETGCTTAHTGCVYMWLTSSTQSAARREHQHTHRHSMHTLTVYNITSPYRCQNN